MRERKLQACWAGLRGALCLAVALILVLSGCTRQFFRRRADNEVAEILAEKDRCPAWKIEQYHVYPDPRARFADPTNPDRPPMPPDDPAAAKLAPRPQKPKNGVARVEGEGYLHLLQEWDEHNRTQLAAQGVTGVGLGGVPQGDSPEELSRENNTATPRQSATATCPPLPGPYLLNLEQASELGLINSREYQSRCEDLYLFALPVTQERFAFTVQLFEAEQAIREWAGKESLSGRQNRWIINSGVGFTKLFSTGALLAVRFANQTVINLTSALTHPTTSVSTINLDLVQPLLRGGGRAVTLEPLTQVERNLVYEIRSFARFRKQFFVFLAGGLDVSFGGVAGGDLTALSSPSGTSGRAITPGVFSTPVGLAGAGGASGGGSAAASFSAILSAGAAGRVNLAADVPALSQGYLPTLLIAAQLATDRKNVAALQRALHLFEGFQEGGEVSPLQVSQVQLQLLQGQNKVLQDAQNLRTALDQFKLQLGTPANVLLELDDAPIRSVARQLDRYEAIQNDSADAVRLVQGKDRATPEEMRAFLRKVFDDHALVKGTRFRAKVAHLWSEWEWLPDDKTLRARISSLRDARNKLLDTRAAAEERKQAPATELLQRLEEVEFEINVGLLEVSLREYARRPWEAQKDLNRRERERLGFFGDVVNAATLVLSDARKERFEELRRSWPELAPVLVDHTDLLTTDLEHAQGVATQTALENRLDLMNQRAQVTDAWRQLRVFANALLGTFNVGYHLDSTTPQGRAKPLAFASSRTRQQLILTAEPPLVRITERNNYRISLIAFQRERRALMAAEDSVASNVRQEIRQLRLLAQNYKIQQQAVDLAYQQVESSLETFTAPPQVGGAGANAASAAALTNQFLQAQTSLVNAQNQLYTIWINYLIARLQLYLDLELMPLDFRGVWIDELASCDLSRADDRSARADQSPTGGDAPGTLPESLPRTYLLPPADATPAR